MTTAPQHRPRVVAYVGNFRPDHSTENHLAASFESRGHTVLRVQEDDPGAWAFLPALAADLVLWTHTWSFRVERSGVPRAMGSAPTVGFHLDRLWGLEREQLITGDARHPFFDVDLLVTADGGHDDKWAAAGIEHRWLPPAVWREGAILRGVPRPDQYPDAVAFVGSSQWYHQEWPWRMELLLQARRAFGRRFGVYPRPGRQVALRGQALADLYATVPVIIGDSCLAGGATRYWSDRIPETIGRGGFLIHPDVEGLADHFDVDRHLFVVPPEDWPAIQAAVEWAWSNPADARAIAEAGRDHVLEHHTYERRVDQLLDLVIDAGLLAP